MLFNSFEYLIFLPIVFLLYWFVFDYALSKCKHQLWLQNLFIVVASYIFYGWWDWRFLILIAITTLCSYVSGLMISRCEHNQSIGGGKCSQLKWLFNPKLWLWANILLNLGILGVYKYYDFFAREFAALLGIESDFLLLHLILPVGISFYTFQALSYSIDVYRGHIQPTKDIVAFTAFLSFFPQLVAGPIERATNLLPQFQRKRSFNYAQAVDGMRQILCGLFKKIVVADNCAAYVDQVWATYDTQSGSTLLLAAILFTFQIYGDFSGYSDIAIGTAKLFGIQLMRNFNVPYFSRDIAEFWRRWHISLTTWFRDYVYIPLGGSRPNIPEAIRLKGDKAIEVRYTKWISVRNTFIIFLLSGFWHGANWTFVLWGAYHALLFVPLLLMGKNRRYRDTVATTTLPDSAIKTKWLPSIKEAMQMLLTFALAVFGWIIFRAENIGQFSEYICNICNSSLFTMPDISGNNALLMNIMILIVVEWMARMRNHGLDIKHLHPVLRYTIYFGVLFLLFAFGGQTANFIYFQF